MLLRDNFTDDITADENKNPTFFRLADTEKLKNYSVDLWTQTKDISDAGLNFHLILVVLFFVLFWILCMLAAINKINFLLQKTLITLVKSRPCVGMNVA